MAGKLYFWGSGLSDDRPQPKSPHTDLRTPLKQALDEMFQQGEMSAMEGFLKQVKSEPMTAEQIISFAEQCLNAMKARNGE